MLHTDDIVIVSVYCSYIFVNCIIITLAGNRFESNNDYNVELLSSMLLINKIIIV